MSKDRIPYIEENTIDVAAAVNDSLRVVDGVVTDRVEAIVDELPQDAKQSDKYAVNAGDKAGLIAKFVETDAGGFWEYFDSVLCELDGVVYVSDGKAWTEVKSNGGLPNNVLTTDDLHASVDDTEDKAITPKAVNAVNTKAVNAQSRADSAYSLAQSKWSPQDTTGSGAIVRKSVTDSLSTRINTADSKAVSAQNRADSAYNLAQTKQDKLEFVGDGKVMREGAYGWGLNSGAILVNDSRENFEAQTRTSVIKGDGTSGTSNVQRWGGGFQAVLGRNIYRIQMTEKGVEAYYSDLSNKEKRYVLLSKDNTTTDSNGFIKSASPIIRLFDDRIETNDQFKEEPIFEKIGVGTYKISNTLGLAKEGWTYEKPRGKDGNPYFHIKVDKLSDGCIISVHDVYEALEEATIIDIDGNERKINRVVKILGEARNIKPHERWIDLRFHEELEEIEEEA